jgi:hypothetical protein
MFRGFACHIVNYDGKVDRCSITCILITEMLQLATVPLLITHLLPVVVHT